MAPVEAFFLLLLSFIGSVLSRSCRKGDGRNGYRSEDCDESKERHGDHDDSRDDDDDDDDDGSSDTTDLIIGVVVGCIVFVLMLALCLLAIRWCRSKNRSKTTSPRAGATRAVHAASSPPTNTYNSPTGMSTPAPPPTVSGGDAPVHRQYGGVNTHLPSPPPYTEPHYANFSSLPIPQTSLTPSKGLAAVEMDPPPPYPAHENHAFVESSAPLQETSSEGQTKH